MLTARVLSIDPCQIEDPITKTGLLRVFKLVPESGHLPTFIGRWDEKAQALDIDIENVPDADKERFAAEAAGFCGHHTIRISNDRRSFLVDSRIPGRQIFRGVVTFTFDLGARAFFGAVAGYATIADPGASDAS